MSEPTAPGSGQPHAHPVDAGASMGGGAQRGGSQSGGSQSDTSHADIARELQQSLAAVSAQLAEVAARVDRFVQAGPANAEAAAAPTPGPATTPTAGPRQAAPPQQVPPPQQTPPLSQGATRQAPPAAYAAPPPQVPPPHAPPPPQTPPPPAAYAAPPPPAYAPPPPPTPPPPHKPFPTPAGAIGRGQASQSTRPGAPASAGSWADTAGLKTLGWVGGAVTVLGIVLLLVVAIQQGLLSPEMRVLIGAVVGGLLLVGGGLLRTKDDRAALAATFVCTGLAALYLTTVGAVRLAGLAGPNVGHGASILIVVAAVSIAINWKEPWIAGVSFAASAILAPVVGDGFDVSVYIFEALMAAGGAACLLLAVGLLPWMFAGSAVALMILAGVTSTALQPGGLLVVVVLAAATWALFVWRWVEEKVPVDPGPFPLRPRSVDPEQVARDYADFHAHGERVAAARADRTTAAISVGIAAGLMVVALAVASPEGIHEVALGIIAAVFAALFAALAWASARIPQLALLSLKVQAWSASVACAAVALLRLLDGDARSISWMVLAVIVLLAVGAERLLSLLVPALVAAALAVLAASPALSPGALLNWPSHGLIDSGGLLVRAWTAVLPAGICVLAVCVASWWAVSRCSAARLAEVRTSIRSEVAAGYAHGYPSDDAAAAASLHTTVMGWTLVSCAAVACYGLLAATMVLAYAVSPTRVGYQAGQISVTIFVTLVALILLWQGFRRMVLRLGGLGIAAVAVTKLLLFDTRNLEALPRAMTVIVVGVLLLLAAVAYVVALSRQSPTNS